MLRIILPLLFFFSLFPMYSQEDCNYKIQYELDDDNFILTHEQLAEFMVGKDQNVFIYFSLMKEGPVKSLVLQVSLNAVEMPPIMCFDKTSRIIFQLEDKSYASLAYLGETICGRQSEPENQLKNSIVEAAFFLDEENLNRLKSSPIETMRITTMKTNFDIVFQEVISNKAIEEPIYPKEYFLKYLDCIE
ncbi:hypothetical protein [Constantimarinum furrinae]|uniref:Uncharacterized protein n=1 Tax=Constantimarinum furrinae TaxID=2562285 RepID=A0A7G8PWV4_9FLAO|nr:hypothetical protein [Constantimarinum furrinae]QNJ98820.1 hypothetical protein ALE3EI_2277 [Constantimarinum furrinae]